MSKKPGSAFGAFAQQKPVQSQDEIAEEARRAEQAAPAGQPGATAPKAPRKRQAPATSAAPGDRVQLMVRLTKADRDRLKEFNLAPYNMTFQQLVVTALNYYLEHKMGQKGRPLQTPATYK